MLFALVALIGAKPRLRGQSVWGPAGWRAGGDEPGAQRKLHAAPGCRERADLSQDFVFQSKGRLTFRRHMFRADWLLSFQPNPGTVFFAGYGSTSERFGATPASIPSTRFALDELLESRYRRSDAFFVK